MDDRSGNAIGSGNATQADVSLDGRVVPIDDRIDARLREAFAPTRLEVINESHLHAGHRGHDGTGESHYRVRIRAEAFRGLTRVGTHRAVNAALANELQTVHALAIDAGPPDDSRA